MAVPASMASVPQTLPPSTFNPSIASAPQTLPPSAFNPSMASVPQTLPPSGFNPSMASVPPTSMPTSIASATKTLPTSGFNPSMYQSTIGPSIPTTALPSNSYYGAAEPQAFPFASDFQTKSVVPGASRDLLSGGYTYEGQGETERFFSKKAKGGYVADSRDLLAAVAVFVAPIFYFAIVYCVLVFQLHFYVAIIAWILVILLAGAIIAAGFLCFICAMQDKASPSVWSFALCIGLLVAYVAAIRSGCKTYVDITQPQFARTGLNTYSNVDPASAVGTSFMDAGILHFSNGAHVDNTKSGGFMNLDMYCVAPIVSSSKGNPVSYDFWAVGVNCCTGASDFQCGDVLEHGDSVSGLRLMSNNQQEFFKLAVSKTAAANNIQAVHPLFFHWVKDAQSGTAAIWALAWKHLWSNLLSLATFQLFLTVFAGFAALWFASKVK